MPIANSFDSCQSSWLPAGATADIGHNHLSYQDTDDKDSKSIPEKHLS